MKTSKHASKRYQQRGFREEYFDILFSYAKPKIKKGGAYELNFSKSEIQDLRSKFKRYIQMLDKMEQKTIILSSEGTIITVYNKY